LRINKAGDFSDVKYDYTEKVKLTFDKEGISIPYPQQDVHMHSVEK
jgi:small conductance mechanosensitive channel